MTGRAAPVSGLNEGQLREALCDVRRIAALDDATALTELDTFAWGLCEASAQAGGETTDDWLEWSREAGRPRFLADVVAARASVAHPAAVQAFDGARLRAEAAVYSDNAAEREEIVGLALELEMAFAEAQITRALTEPITSATSLPRHFRLVALAVADLQRRGRLTTAHEQLRKSARSRGGFVGRQRRGGLRFPIPMSSWS